MYLTMLCIWTVASFQLSEEGPGEDLNGDGQLSSFNEWMLPAKEFDGMWERFAFYSHIFHYYYVDKHGKLDFSYSTA